MTDHYIAHMQSEIRQLRQERDLLHAKIAQLEARENRVRDRVARWRTDDAESLTLFGQHAAAGLGVLADQIAHDLGDTDGG
jgi:phage shock protein A